VSWNVFVVFEVGIANSSLSLSSWLAREALSG